MDYPSGAKAVSVESPWSKETLGKVVRKSYISLSASVVESPRTSEKILIEVAKKEMKEICSQTYNSILGDSNEAVKHFSWNCYRKSLLYLTCLHAWLKIQTSQNPCCV